MEGDLRENPDIWRRFGDLNPEGCVRRIGKLLRQWFPAAFASDATPLPCAPPFQHMFLGLCNWADWIGSDERYFEYCDEPRDDYIEHLRLRGSGPGKLSNAIGLDLSPQRDRSRACPNSGSVQHRRFAQRDTTDRSPNTP